MTFNKHTCNGEDPDFHSFINVVYEVITKLNFRISLALVLRFFSVVMLLPATIQLINAQR